MTHLVIPLICFLLLGTSAARAADGEEILSFARALAAEGDHYRAITEYKRFLHLFPEEPAAAKVRLAIAESYVAGHRWEEAEQTLAGILADSADTAERKRATRLYADIPFRRGDFATARQRYRSLIEKTADPEELRRLRYFLAWSHVEGGDYGAACRALAPLTDAASREFAGELEHMANLPLKSPRLAGGLSAVLPGAGQLYADRPRDAALALLLNGAFLWGALEAFDSGNEATGAILLFFEAGWYTGNIFNAVNSTHKYNRDLRLQATEPLRRRFGPSIGRSGSVPTLGIAGRF